MARRDSVFEDGQEVRFKQWPDDGAGGIDPDGMVDDWDGTVRPLTDDERAEVAADVDELERITERSAVRDDLELAKTSRDEAQQSRADMDPADGRRKWTRGVADPADHDAHHADLQAEVRRLHGDVRLLSAIIVRLIRSLELDR